MKHGERISKASRKAADDPAFWSGVLIACVGVAIVFALTSFYVEPTEHSPTWLIPVIKFVVLVFSALSTLFSLIAAYFRWELRRKK